MKDEDIHAFGAPPVQPVRPRPPTASAHSTPPPGAQPRRNGPWLLLALSALVLLLVILLIWAGASTLIGMLDGARDGWHVSVNGHPLSTLHADTELGALGALGVTPAVLMLLLMLLVVVLPVLLMLVLLAVALAVGLALLSAVGAVVLAACAVLLLVALVTSPVWGLLLLLWLLLRRPRQLPSIAAGPAQA